MSAPQPGPTEERKSTPRLRPGERRRQLLAHARYLLATQGYSATPSEVAAAAGVRESLFHRYFADKQAFVLEVIAEIRTNTLARWEVEASAAPDPLARIQAILDALLRWPNESPQERQVLQRILTESDDPVVLAAVRELYAEGQTYLTQLLVEGQQAGVFRRSLDPRVGAWQLLASAWGNALLQPLQVELHTEPEFRAWAIDSLLHGLLKTDI